MRTLSHLKSQLPLTLCIAALFATTTAQAGPSGRSARRAAQLKKVAPGWLSHYLPDDRYKIDGKVWRYVSTDLDTYYHRPDSPLMLRQPADHVIGFASAKDAEEAGYMPEPGLPAASGGMSGSMMGAGMGSPSSRTGTVVLGDGVSTVMLPVGWTHTKGPSQSAQGVTATRDMFVQPGSKNVVLIQTVTKPGENFAAQVTQAAAQKNLSALARAGEMNGGAMANATQMLSGIKVRPATWGSLKGITFSMAFPGRNGARATVNSVMVARGSKLYAYTILGGGPQATGLRSLMSSFRPR